MAVADKHKELYNRYDSIEKVENILDDNTKEYYSNFLLRSFKMEKYGPKIKEQMLIKGEELGLDNDSGYLDFQDKYDYELLKFDKAYGDGTPRVISSEREKELIRNKDMAQETFSLRESGETDRFISRMEVREIVRDELKKHPMAEATSVLTELGDKLKEAEVNGELDKAIDNEKQERVEFINNEREILKEYLKSTDGGITGREITKEYLRSTDHGIDIDEDELPF